MGGEMNCEDLYNMAKKRVLDFKSIEYVLSQPSAKERIAKADSESVKVLTEFVIRGDRKGVSEWLKGQKDKYDQMTVIELRDVAYRLGISQPYKIPGKFRLIEAIKNASVKDKDQQVP